LTGGSPRVLIIVENLPVQRDPRVRRECHALVEAGYGVSVISPAGNDDDDMPEELRGVAIHQYPPPAQPESRLGYGYEFLYSWIWAARLTVHVWRREGFDVIQACNPPDTYFLLALPFKALGRRFVFDHHDLSPELYRVRFGQDGRLVPVALRALERATFAVADHVISTNESFRRVACTRGGKRTTEVTVVRNGPELTRLPPPRQRPELKRGRPFLCCWVGVMGAVDDGVDLALAAIHHVVHSRGRRDCHFAFLGDGEAFDDMQHLTAQLGLTDDVTFTGWVSSEEVYDYLGTADVGLQPDPKNLRTDLATATKTMEYMAFGLPIVAFDVDETRMSAGEAAVYAEGNDPRMLGDLVVSLLDDPARRARMGAAGRQRVERELGWDHQKAAYVGVFDRLLGRG
jgi:glycosyltransferase involved in cell wall biosynthesis